MNARDAIDEVILRTVQQGWQCDVQTDEILNALRAAAGGADRVVLDWSGTPCATCGGDGWKPGARPDEWGAPEKACPTCGGSGSGGDVVLHGLEEASSELVRDAPFLSSFAYRRSPLWRLVPVTPEEES